MKKANPPHGKDANPHNTGSNRQANGSAASYKDNPPDSELNQHNMDGQYEVEEEYLQRSNYENTKIFMMEIEKAKERATTMAHPFPHEADQEQQEAQRTFSETEKQSIKQTLEDIRRAEEKERLEFEKSVRRQSGLLGSLKKIFSKD